MAPLLPPTPTKDDFRRLVDDPLPWLPAVGALAARHGLPAPAAADHRPGGFLVFTLGDAVLKMTPPWWESEVRGERVSLRAAAGRLPLPSPELLHEGEFEGWPYLLLSRLPGEPLGWAALRALGPGPRASLCRAAGEVLRALHALPAGGFDGLPVHGPSFEAARRQAAVEAQRRWGVPESMVGELEEALAAAPPLLSGPPVPIHADLHHGNLLVADPAAARPTGVIDFGDAALGPPEFDLAVPALFLPLGDGRALDALFDGYGIPGARRDPAFRRRLLLWMFLHPFGDMTRFLPRPDGTRRGNLAEMEREILPPT